MKTIQILRRASFLLVLSLLSAISMRGMSYSEARDRAWYLTDKMAYELNLTQEQYDKAYQINLDYLMSIQTPTTARGAIGDTATPTSNASCCHGSIRSTPRSTTSSVPSVGCTPLGICLYSNTTAVASSTSHARQSTSPMSVTTGVGADTATPAPTAISSRGTDRACEALDVPMRGPDIRTGTKAFILPPSVRRAPKNPAAPV